MILGEFSLTKDFVSDGDIPRYAILSHTWGADTEEATFKDMVDGTDKGKPGYNKISFCSAGNKPDAMICNTLGSTPAASTSQTAPSFRRLSTPCFAGIVTPLNATCILPMSRTLTWTPTAGPGSYPSGNRLFRGAGGLPGDGPFRSLLLRR